MSTDTLEPGDTLDHYRIDATVARSGMATLYRATDTHNHRQVALKVPHPEMEADTVLVERFKREQEIGQLLDHPGVVKTFNSEQRTRLYMVLEWVEGRLLRTILNEQGALPVDARGADHAAHLRRARLHAQARHRAPRPQAGKHHGQRSRRNQAHRLRHRHERGREKADLRERLVDAGHARLHLPRTGAGQARRSAQRHVRARRHVLRDAHRPRAILRAQSAGGHERAPAERPHSASRTEPRNPARTGRDHFPRSGERSAPPLRERPRNGMGPGAQGNGGRGRSRLSSGAPRPGLAVLQNQQARAALRVPRAGAHHSLRAHAGAGQTLIRH